LGAKRIQKARAQFCQGAHGGAPLVHVAAGESDPPRGGLTAPFFAAGQRSLDAIRALVSSHADLNLARPGGASALVVAIINGHYHVADVFLKAVADPNLPTDFEERLCMRS